MDIEALFSVSYGLYTISSKNQAGKLNGYIGNTAFQITAEPIQFAVCCHKNNFTTSCIDESKVFSVSVLSEDTDSSVFGEFGFKSGKDIEKFTSKNHIIGKTGAPIFTENVVAYIECKVTNKVDVGTHFMFIGEVVDAKVLDSNKIPMTYDYYHKKRKGVAPKNASTFVDLKQIKPKEEKMAEETIYKCDVCGYTTENDGSFENLPEDWVCPVCGVGKDQFSAE